MKKILIVIPAFTHGGTNRSLVNFLNKTNLDNCDIHILSMNWVGPYQQVFSQYHLLPEDNLLESISSFTKAGTFLSTIKRLFGKLFFKICCNKDVHVLYCHAAKKYSRMRFDTVVAFQEGDATNFVSCINAKRHVAWVRCDYSNYQSITGNMDESEIYSKFDSIICVSNYTATVFENIYPFLSNRIHGIHNIIDSDHIISAALEDISDMDISKDLFKVVSVGRMDPVKRFTYIPKFASQMKKTGCIFKWYIIGAGGTEFDAVKHYISEFEVDDCVILLGSKSNPYPYIKHADLLVCPSLSEACPNVVNEAKILHTPVIAADFPSAPEYIKDKVNGMILPIDSIGDAIVRMYSHREELIKMNNEISKFHYDNDAINSRIIAQLEGNDE